MFGEFKRRYNYRLKSLAKYSIEFNNLAVQMRPHQIAYLRLLGRPYTLPYVRRSVGRLTEALLTRGEDSRVEGWRVCAVQTPKSWLLERRANLFFGTLRETFSQTLIRFHRAKCLAVKRQVLDETTYLILTDPQRDWHFLTFFWPLKERLSKVEKPNLRTAHTSNLFCPSFWNWLLICLLLCIFSEQFIFIQRQ